MRLVLVVLWRPKRPKKFPKQFGGEFGQFDGSWVAVLQKISFFGVATTSLWLSGMYTIWLVFNEDCGLWVVLATTKGRQGWQGQKLPPWLRAGRTAPSSCKDQCAKRQEWTELSTRATSRSFSSSSLHIVQIVHHFPSLEMLSPTLRCLYLAFLWYRSHCETVKVLCFKKKDFLSIKWVKFTVKTYHPCNDQLIICIYNLLCNKIKV